MSDSNEVKEEEEEEVEEQEEQEERESHIETNKKKKIIKKMDIRSENGKRPPPAEQCVAHLNNLKQGQLAVSILTTPNNLQLPPPPPRSPLGTLPLLHLTRLLQLCN